MKNVYQMAATLARHIRGATRLGKQQMVFDGVGQAGDADRHANAGIDESLAERADRKPQLLGDQRRLVAIGIGHQYRSEEHTSELQSLMRISYAVFCLKNKTTTISTIICERE